MSILFILNHARMLIYRYTPPFLQIIWTTERTKLLANLLSQLRIRISCWQTAKDCSLYQSPALHKLSMDDWWVFHLEYNWLSSAELIHTCDKNGCSYNSCYRQRTNTEKISWFFLDHKNKLQVNHISVLNSVHLPK